MFDGEVRARKWPVTGGASYWIQMLVAKLTEVDPLIEYSADIGGRGLQEAVSSAEIDHWSMEETADQEADELRQPRWGPNPMYEPVESAQHTAEGLLLRAALVQSQVYTANPQGRSQPPHSSGSVWRGRHAGCG